jgi:hypothetical protein
VVNDRFAGYMAQAPYVGLEVGRDVVAVIGEDGGVEKGEGVCISQYRVEV